MNIFSSSLFKDLKSRLSKFFSRNQKYYEFEGRRSEINLGDLATALSYFPNATDKEREVIASSLGFHIKESKETIDHHPQYRPTHAAYNRALLKDRVRSRLQKPPEFTPKPAMPPKPESVPTQQGAVLSTEMKIEEAPPNVEAIQNPSLLGAEALSLNKTLSPLPRQTLFSNRTYRGIVSAASMQETPGSELDISQLIRTLTCRQQLKKLPVLPRFTTRNGSQLLLDYHEALMPWWEDMQSLIRQFHRVLGEEQCPVYEFDHSPSTAFRWTEKGELPWQPVPGKPVVIATDLGVLQATRGAPRPGRSDWVQFIKTCGQTRSPVIVCSPLHPRRCPYGLDRIVTLIHWHPATTAAMVDRLTRHSRGNTK